MRVTRAPTGACFVRYGRYPEPLQAAVEQIPASQGRAHLS
jgi:hypothetical protein